MPVKKTNEEFIKEARELVGDEYTFLEEYVNSTVKIKVMHNNADCGNHIYSVTPSKFLFGRRCPKCAIKNNGSYSKLTNRKVDEWMTQNKKQFKRIGEYTGYDNNISFECLTCNNTWDVSFSNVKKIKQCPYCYGNKKLTSEDVDSWLSDNNIPLERIGEYVRYHDHTLMRCLKCEHTWGASIAHIKSGKGCPNCASSKGEIAIYNILKKYGIEFKKEYKFEDCRDKLPLSFDFAILNKGDVALLIEHDGLQHYKAIGYFGGEEGFKVIQRRDKIKNDYCERNNIRLLRIPIWEFDNIEGILKKEIGEVFANE